jgi:hypothetical protein
MRLVNIIIIQLTSLIFAKISNLEHFCVDLAYEERVFVCYMKKKFGRHYFKNLISFWRKIAILGLYEISSMRWLSQRRNCFIAHLCS